MLDIYLTNSLTRKKEKFEAINPPNVGIYTCGPTVYDYPTIGNWRTYTLSDLVVRVLKFSGYKVKYIMNLTDVGHLTGDNLGDADTGEDRLEKAAKKERKSAWDIAKFYGQDFIESYGKMNLTKPEIFSKATDHIKEQIDLVKKLEDNGFTYKTSDGIYFDTEKYETKGFKYGELSTLDQIKEGARVEINEEKKNPRDFALWKFSPTNVKRDMEWESPWGLGFPGWHIECSAMSMKYLGEQFDIHIGGEDLRQTHHPNEIAQAEAATGKKPFVKYWIHGAFLRVDGGRMGKSLGNAYTLDDIENRGFNPLSLRYLYLTGFYKDALNFTWESLTSAQTALYKLYEHMSSFRAQNRTTLSEEKRKKTDEYMNRFNNAIADDFNMPKALAVLWESVKSNIPSEDKYDLLSSFDEVLGLKLREAGSTQEIPEEINELAKKREEFRQNGDFKNADNLRGQIEAKGYTVKDNPDGFILIPNNNSLL